MHRTLCSYSAPNTHTQKKKQQQLTTLLLVPVVWVRQILPCWKTPPFCSETVEKGKLMDGGKGRGGNQWSAHTQNLRLDELTHKTCGEIFLLEGKGGSHQPTKTTNACCFERTEISLESKSKKRSCAWKTHFSIIFFLYIAFHIPFVHFYAIPHNSLFLLCVFLCNSFCAQRCAHEHRAISFIQPVLKSRFTYEHAQTENQCSPE